MLEYAYSPEPGEQEEISELTAIQRKMYICNKLPLYRLPLLYPLDADTSYGDVRAALYTVIKAHKTLQVKYEYDPQLRKFFQRYTPLQPENFSVEPLEIHEAPEAYIRACSSGIDLAAHYPWRLTFLEWLDQRFLYVEFHHIAVDGLGIRRFEQDFIGRLLEGQEIVPQTSLPLSGYRAICELQRHNTAAAEVKERLLRLPALQCKPAPGAGRLAVSLTAARQEAVQQLALRLKVTKNAVFQGLLEEVLGRMCSGDTYGTIGNWRMRIGNFTEAGCYVRMMPKQIQTEEDAESRIRNIHGSNLQSFRDPGNDSHGMIEYPIVYSYEEDMFRHFRYIPADRMCKFELYIRVYHYQQENGIEVEYSKSKYSDDQIAAIINDLGSRLDDLAEKGDSCEFNRKN